MTHRFHFLFCKLSSTYSWGGVYWLMLYTFRLIIHMAYKQHTIEMFYRQLVLEYFTKYYSAIIEEYKRKPHEASQPLSKDNVIWVCWFQGEENMPPLVKQCYKLLLQNSNGHEVVLLTNENIREYVEIPKEIYDKVDSGKMLLAHFSDILRMCLLAKYGGLWVDATYWITRPIEIDGNPFYTLKQDDKEAIHISRGQWACNCIGAGSNYYVFAFVRDCLLAFYLDNSPMKEYFLFDYIFLIAYNSFSDFRDIIDSMPYRSPDILKVQYSIFEPYKKEVMGRILKDNVMLKLTYRIDEALKPASCFTNYDYFMSL